MSSVRPRRSVLYMPGSNARALEKARGLPADALILDLEDAVAPDAKELARKQVCEAVRSGAYGYRELAIRTNGLDTPWGREDLEAAAAAEPDAILVPKVSSAAMLLEIESLVERAGASGLTRLWVMLETPAGIQHADEIAGASRWLELLVMGTNDLAKELHAAQVPGREPLLTSLELCLIAARAHGLVILDGVYNDIRSSPATAPSRRATPSWSRRAGSSKPSSRPRPKAGAW
jgi:citrate lyase subunit beta/citryl-CoA lyase